MHHLDGIKPPITTPGTWAAYDQTLRIHIAPKIGKVPLAKLTPQHLQKLYADHLAAGAAPNTVKRSHIVLHRALKQAQRWGMVARSVADMVDGPKSEKRPRPTYSAELARSFLAAVADHPLEAVFVLAITTGMRKGEILALKWDAADLDRGTLQVRANLRQVDQAIAQTKTASSRRRIQLTDRAVAALKRQRARQAEARLRAGADWQDLGLVFATATGGPLRGNHVNDTTLPRILRAAGLPRIRFHDLRHSAATLLLEEGMHPKIVSEMLGHSTIAITLDLYSHVTPTMQRQATEAMNRLLEG
jgi:integrase